MAVLPFVSLTAVAALDRDGAILAANLATLFRSDPWRVTAAPVGTPVAHGPDLHVRHLGRWLNADLVLVGHVSRQGQGVETCVQLIDTVTGLTRWRWSSTCCGGSARPESVVAVRMAREIRSALMDCQAEL